MKFDDHKILDLVCTRISFFTKSISKLTQSSNDFNLKVKKTRCI